MEGKDFIELLNKHEENLKEFITASDKVTHAKVINEVDRVGAQINEVSGKVDDIIKHQEWQNGKLSKHDDAIIALEKQDITFDLYQQNCSANKLAKKLDKKWTWIAIFCFVFLTSIASVWVYHNVDWLKTFERRTGIELVKNQ